MDKIQKLIIATLGLALAVIMVVGIVVSVTRKDEKSDIEYDEKDFKTSTTTVTTTTKPDNSDTTTTTTQTETDDTDTTTTTPTTSDEESDSSTTSNSTTTTTTKKEDKPSGELEIAASDLTVLIGKTKNINVEFSDESDKPTLTFKSGNTKVATVDKNGKVKGVALGSCKVTISTSTGDNVTINVKVTDEFGTEATTSKTMYANGCNFRKGPGVGYSVIRVLDVNEKITIIGKNGAWYKVTAGGTTGFVKGDFLSTTKFPENTGDNGNSGGNTTTPDEPVTPDEPDTPDEPVTPDEPDTPDEPETPDEPDTPGEPTDNPDEPAEGEDTGNSEENAETNE